MCMRRTSSITTDRQSARCKLRLNAVRDIERSRQCAANHLRNSAGNGIHHGKVRDSVSPCRTCAELDQVGVSEARTAVRPCRCFGQCYACVSGVVCLSGQLCRLAWISGKKRKILRSASAICKISALQMRFERSVFGCV